MDGKRLRCAVVSDGLGRSVKVHKALNTQTQLAVAATHPAHMNRTLNQKKNRKRRRTKHTHNYRSARTLTNRYSGSGLNTRMSKSIALKCQHNRGILNLFFCFCSWLSYSYGVRGLFRTSSVEIWAPAPRINKIIPMKISISIHISRSLLCSHSHCAGFEIVFCFIQPRSGGIVNIRWAGHFLRVHAIILHFKSNRLLFLTINNPLWKPIDRYQL